MSSGYFGMQTEFVGERLYYSPDGIRMGKFDARFGFFANNQWVINFGLDLSRISTTYEQSSGSYTYESEESVTFLGILAGAKYYFNEPRAGQVSFYNQTSISVLIPISPTFETTTTGEDEDYSYNYGSHSGKAVERVLDDVYAYGFSEGIGAEYFVSDFFSIGGEFGLKACFLGFDEGVTVDVYYLEFYSGITLNFLK